MTSHPMSCKSILILSSHLRLGLPSGWCSTWIVHVTLYIRVISKCMGHVLWNTFILMGHVLWSTFNLKQKQNCLKWKSVWHEDILGYWGSVMSSCFIEPLTRNVQRQGEHKIFETLWTVSGAAVAQLVEALRYIQEGRGFDSWWCHWNFSLA
jgi:hypothetical protein